MLGLGLELDARLEFGLRLGLGSRLGFGLWFWPLFEVRLVLTLGSN